MLPFDRIRGELARAPETLGNVELSTSARIEDDFHRASVALYRGSSSVLYAIQSGLKPLYWHSERHMDVDPLFELTEWRDEVSGIDEAVEALSRFAVVDGAAATQAWGRVVGYARGYAVPVDGASIDRMLSAAGLARGSAGDP